MGFRRKIGKPSCWPCKAAARTETSPGASRGFSPASILILDNRPTAMSKAKPVGKFNRRSGKKADFRTVDGDWLPKPFYSIQELSQSLNLNEKAIVATLLTARIAGYLNGDRFDMRNWTHGHGQRMFDLGSNGSLFVEHFGYQHPYADEVLVRGDDLPAQWKATLLTKRPPNPKHPRADLARKFQEVDKASGHSLTRKQLLNHQDLAPLCKKERINSTAALYAALKAAGVKPHPRRTGRPKSEK
jgi:hypothetical protein